MNRRFLAGVIFGLFVGLSGTGSLSAAPGQQPRPVPQPQPAPTSPAPVAPAAPIDERSARDTQQRLRELLRNYPPSLNRVLQLDPTLLTNQDYLAPYPALATFIAQHPDIVHHAAFYLGQPDSGGGPEDSRSRAIQIFGNVIENAFVLCGFIAAFVTIGWLGRLIVDHRRWLRATRTQTEVHAKLFDRLTSNEELIAYIQTPSGQRFLQSAPIPLDAGPRAIGAPISRILWSVQVGIVLAVVGIGLWFGKNNAVDELIGPLNIVAILVLALGVGFAISAAVAYGMSQRLGLLEPPKP